MSDIASEVRDILAFHLGVEPARVTDQARLAKDLGADSLDVVEVVMSCEERFGVEIPNRAATGLVTVADAVRCVEAQLAAAETPARPAAQPAAQPADRPVHRLLAALR